MIFSPQIFPAPDSVPARKPVRMEAQPVVPWTVPLLLAATWQWLIAESWTQESVRGSDG